MKKKSFLIVFALLGISLSLILGNLKLFQQNQPESLPLFPSSEGQFPERSDTIWFEGEILPQQGIFQALLSMGVPAPLCLSIINTIRDEVSLTDVTVGQKMRVALSPDLDQVWFFEFRFNAATFTRFSQKAGKYQIEQIVLPTDTNYRLVNGTIKEGSSLDNQLNGLDIPKNLIGIVNGVLMCKINFQADARKGDKFRVLLRERYYQGELIDGYVLYAEYNGPLTGHFEAFRYIDPEPKSSYTAHYTRDGEALIHSGLRYPLDRIHLSSDFGMRIHPVTGRYTMHNGVDYSGSTGTPVYSVAEGLVTVSSYDPYSGNKIAIKHSDGFSSWYLHLVSRGVRVGQRVGARQMIGRLGGTGRVTGPHLHFGFRDAKGAWVDPLKKTMIATQKLSGDRFNRLQQQIHAIEEILFSKMKKKK